MPNGLPTAIAIWTIFLGLIYIGVFAETWDLGKRIRNASSTREWLLLWVVRILYIIALPIVLVLVVLGAVHLWEGLKNLFKD